MSQITNAEWKLQNLEIKLQEWGEFKGKYVGQIRFQNKEQEAFMFNIRPEMANEYMNLIKGEIVTSAENMGKKLLESLNLLPAPSEKKEIGTTIEEIKTEEPVLPF